MLEQLARIKLPLLGLRRQATPAQRQKSSFFDPSSSPLRPGTSSGMDTKLRFGSSTSVHILLTAAFLMPCSSVRV